ncbi:MAG: alcohol dehydrogenase catalytic domain-containing protein [Phycisphaerae bacterium]
MRALTFDTSVKYRQYHPDPTPGPDDALIQVQLAGLCQTDLEIARGYMGFKGILGHEFVGTVLKSADTKLVGQRVVGEINCVCGHCDMCLGGLSAHCRNRSVLGISQRDGAFADLLVLPNRNLHVVPKNISDEEAVFTEPLAAAVQILRQVKVEKRSRVTVLGDGRLGQLVVQVIRQAGVGGGTPVTLVGHHAGKLALAERLGGGGTVSVCLEKDLQPRHDQDLVVDCTGSAAGVLLALRLLRPRGTLVLKTTVAAGVPLNLSPLVIDEITVVGSRCGPFRDALALLAQKQVDVSGLISRRVKIDAAEELFTSPLGADTLKVLIRFDR